MSIRLITRIFVLTIVAVLSFSEAKAQVYVPKEKTIGVEVGYNSRNVSALTGITFSYRFNRYFRLSPNVQYVFRNQRTDGFSINIDGHAPFDIKNSPIELYPVLGVNYSLWNKKTERIQRELSDDVSGRENNFGLNLGGGVGMRCAGHMRLFVEGRYTFIRHFSSAMVIAGIVYSF